LREKNIRSGKKKQRNCRRCKPSSAIHHFPSFEGCVCGREYHNPQEDWPQALLRRRVVVWSFAGE
jgi:hypothetical protein